MKSTLPIRALLACLLTGLASVAAAQNGVSANMELSRQPAMSAADAAKVHPFCVQETGTRIHQVRSASGRASDCATALPGRTYTREDIDRTGEVELSQALRKLDPSIH